MSVPESSTVLYVPAMLQSYISDQECSFTLIFCYIQTVHYLNK